MERGYSGQKKKNRILPAITVVACAFLAFGVMVIFHACGPKEDGTWMSCHYAQLTVFGLALAMTAASGTCLLISKAGKRDTSAACMALYGIVAALAIAAAVIPGNVIHLCMMNEMRCRAVMRPSVILVSIVIIILALASAWNSRKTR